MKKEFEMRRDADIIDEILSEYDNQDCAHFIVIGQKDGTRFHFSGGNADLLEMYLTEGLARLIDAHPALEKTFADKLALHVRQILTLLQSFRRSTEE